MMYPFKKAKLNDCNGILDKRWYIEFYAWDVQKSILLRKRSYDINNYTTEKDRRNAARRIIKEINELLEGGYHFDTNKASPESEDKSSESYTLGGGHKARASVKKALFEDFILHLLQKRGEDFYPVGRKKQDLGYGYCLFRQAAGHSL